MARHDENALADRQVALIDLLDRLLSGGVVLTGDLVLSIADIDLVKISLRAVIVAAQGDDQWALTSLMPGVQENAPQELEGPRRDRPL
ncbi:gas vesicle protein [Streptomyces solicathayae]|uniref:Gas vesicle protein n=1 Tax=Streptomyces solicathayae TaxID=3081768 RepID=A0ABZ0M511_9ACTN|nr:gas vesicle protein [Streptomyces sp. HUAS YS2]WOX26526.1 gas vesicle protein [Streptomyces sp. HUAS YS2]